MLVILDLALESQSKASKKWAAYVYEDSPVVTERSAGPVGGGWIHLQIVILLSPCMCVPHTIKKRGQCMEVGNVSRRIRTT